MKFISPEEKLKTIGFKFSKESQQSTFQFVKKDFDVAGSTKQIDSQYRIKRMQEIKKEMISNLSSYFDGFQGKVGASNVRAKYIYKPYTWMGFWEGKDKFDTLQYQITFQEKPEVTVGLWIEGKGKKKSFRTKILEQLVRKKKELLLNLRDLPSGYFVILKNDDKKLNQEWDVSQISDDEFDIIKNEMENKNSKLGIRRYFEKEEALNLKTDAIAELTDAFETLVPLERLLMGKPKLDSDASLEDIVDKILSGDPENGEHEIAVERDVVLRILIHLDAGKHVILVGAPGVGKTMLAKRILDVYGWIKTTQPYLPSVATAEWSRHHVVGSLDLQDKWNPGYVSEAAKAGKWLLIDEFNRADINKAFGEMFLALEDHKIPLSSKEKEITGSISIPDEFRIIGTMNDYDKNLLLTELSYGLITRFAFVDIKPDEKKEEESVKKQIIENNLELTEKDWDSCSEEIKKFFEFTKEVRKWRMIGVRTTIDVIRYMIYASTHDPSKNNLNYLDEALCDYLLPQFDRLDKKTIEDTEKASKKMRVKGFTDGLTQMKKDLERMSNLFT